MPDAPPLLPLYARPPGNGPSPRGIYVDGTTSVRLAKTLTKAVRPSNKGKRYKTVHRAKPDKAHTSKK
jgi:hypothetical protein